MIRKGAKTAAVAGGTVAYEPLAPSVALAESPSGADLLLPKPLSSFCAHCVFDHLVCFRQALLGLLFSR